MQREVLNFRIVRAARLAGGDEPDAVVRGELVPQQHDVEGRPGRRADLVPGVRARDLDPASVEFELQRVVAQVQLSAKAIADLEVPHGVQRQLAHLEILLAEDGHGVGPIGPVDARLRRVGELLLEAVDAADHPGDGDPGEGDIVLGGERVAPDREAAVQSVDTLEFLVHRIRPQSAHDRADALVAGVGDVQVLPRRVVRELHGSVHGA
mmetsp:Transcript_121111/g.387809  ORF Transcript_121111/g.387809 Transcript_121111/m.387809 type:complete len:209 (-) Transcript_121111:78-704(-)